MRPVPCDPCEHRVELVEEGDALKTSIVRVLSIRCRDLLERAMLSEMSWLDIFAEPDAEELPPDLRRLGRPLVLWYASAGRNFRPLVFTTPSYQARLSARIGELLQLPEPDLFVYTCLDEDYEPWHEDEVLHEDYGTLVRCRSATPVRLNRQLVPWAKVRGSARFGRDPRLYGEPDGHILDVEVLSLMGMGTFRRKILYLRYENNLSWDALFGSSWSVVPLRSELRPTSAPGLHRASSHDDGGECRPCNSRSARTNMVGETERRTEPDTPERAAPGRRCAGGGKE